MWIRALQWVCIRVVRTCVNITTPVVEDPCPMKQRQGTRRRSEKEVAVGSPRRKTHVCRNASHVCPWLIHRETCKPIRVFCWQFCCGIAFVLLHRLHRVRHGINLHLRATGKYVRFWRLSCQSDLPNLILASWLGRRMNTRLIMRNYSCAGLYRLH